MAEKTTPRLYWIVLAGILEFVALQPLFGSEAPTRIPKAAPGTSVELQNAIDDAFDFMNQRDYVRAEAAFQKVMANRGFGRIGGVLQHAIYSADGFAARELKQWRTAHASFTQATGMPQATGEEWWERTQAAYMVGHTTDAVLSLTVIANAYPDLLARFFDRFVFRLASQAEDLPDRNLYFNLLNALYDRNWKVADGREPGLLWRPLAIELMRRGQMKRAAEVAARVQSARQRVTMQADARFDPLLKSDSAQFDVKKGLSLEITLLRSTTGKQPRRLDHKVELQYLLLASRQYDEVIQIADAAVAAISSGNKDQPAYDDIDDSLPWILDNRARALVRLGRMQDAIDQLQKAARMSELGKENVSQAINLAELLIRLNRSDEALAAISTVKDPSPYGRMLVHYVKFVAATQKQDARAAAAAMSYLQSHQKDAAGTYSDALLIANRIDEAARILIKRLEDVDTLASALFGLQEFASGASTTPLGKLLEERSQALVSRPDVQAALGKVGRIRRYDIDRPEA